MQTHTRLKSNLMLDTRSSILHCKALQLVYHPQVFQQDYGTKMATHKISDNLTTRSIILENAFVISLLRRPWPCNVDTAYKQGFISDE